MLINYISNTYTLIKKTLNLCFIKKGFNEILLIRLDGVGDFILWLDSAKHYRSIYPEKKIVLLANSAFIELAKTLPYWDEVLSCNLKLYRFFPIYRLYKILQIRRRKFDTVINPVLTRDFLTTEQIVKWSHSNEKIAFSSKDYSDNKINISHYDKYYTRFINSKPGLIHEIVQNCEFINVLSGAKFTAGIPQLAVNESKLLINFNKDKYIAIAPSAGWDAKKWPTKFFVELLIKLDTNFNYKFILIGTKKDANLCQEIINESNIDAINYAGKSSLLELIEIIRKCICVIGNDSSPAHIAAAVNTPSICIVGGGHFGRFFPYINNTRKIIPVPIYSVKECYNCNWNCIKDFKGDSAYPCISDITVETTYQAVLNSIGASNER